MIISFDPMKLQKDVIGNQPSQTFVKNLITLVKTNFPGTSHIAVSIPMNSTSELQSHGTNPSPLSVEAYIDFWIDTIHNAGFGVLLRTMDCGMEKIYNFPLTVNTSSWWINRAMNFLTVHKAHLKNGDIFSPYPEADGNLFAVGQAVNNGDNNYHADYNSLWQGLTSALTSWNTTNGLQLLCYLTVNGTSINNASYDGTTITPGTDKFENETSITMIGGIVMDWYNFGNAPIDASGYMAWYKTSLDYYYNLYGMASHKIFVQEWGDTRGSASGVVQAADPLLTANMADQIFFPALFSGELFGINFWNLFDTPQEGIVKIQGDNVTLNTKGASLSFIFKKWFGNNPSRKIISSGTVSDDGKGNLLMNLKYVTTVALITAIFAISILVFPLLLKQSQEDPTTKGDRYSQFALCDTYSKADLTLYPKTIPARCVEYLSSKK